MTARILGAVRMTAGGILVACALAGCSSILPGKSASPDIYKFPASTQPTLVASASKVAALQLVVDTPTAARALDTDRIAVRTDTYELAYLAGARWDDSAPRVVQARLIEAFERAGAAGGVGRAEDGMRADIGFVSELRAFEVVTRTLAAPTVNVQIAAKLVGRPLGAVRDTRVFEAQVKAASSRDRDVIAAFDQALITIGNDAAAWTIATLAR